MDQEEGAGWTCGTLHIERIEALPWARPGQRPGAEVKPFSLTSVGPVRPAHLTPRTANSLPPPSLPALQTWRVTTAPGPVQSVRAQSSRPDTGASEVVQGKTIHQARGEAESRRGTGPCRVTWPCADDVVQVRSE